MKYSFYHGIIYFLNIHQDFTNSTTLEPVYHEQLCMFVVFLGQSLKALIEKEYDSKQLR